MVLLQYPLDIAMLRNIAVADITYYQVTLLLYLFNLNELQKFSSFNFKQSLTLLYPCKCCVFTQDKSSTAATAGFFTGILVAM